MSSQDHNRNLWGQFAKDRIALCSLVFVLLFSAMAIFAPFIANDRPIVQTENFRLMPPIPFGPGSYDLDDVLSPPSAKHIFGTDGEGRDVAAGIVWGARVSLSVGIVAVGIAVLIGIFFGAIAGYYGGWADMVISRFIEIVICFPTFFLILCVLAFVGPSIYNIMIVIGLTGWPGVARLTRGEFLKLRRREYVTAAQVSGATNGRIILRHILPASLAPVIVAASFGVAGAILVESALSFLGFGVPPSTPSWGSILAEAQAYVGIAWWLTLTPGFAIFLTITALNLIGETLRDMIDPNTV